MNAMILYKQKVFFKISTALFTYLKDALRTNLLLSITHIAALEELSFEQTALK